MSINRRQFVQGSVVMGLGSLSGCIAHDFLNKTSEPLPEHQYKLVVKESHTQIFPNTNTPIMAYDGSNPALVIRAAQGRPVRIEVTNQLQEPTTVHWHGLRIPVYMDGVPYTGQVPILPGETFTYEFIPPDAGTMWYHSHFNSVTQMGMGLVGAMVVDEEKPVAFDHDITLLFKNWNIKKSGQSYPLSIKRLAARKGTPGLLYTTNGVQSPSYEITANSAVRVRLINADNTLLYRLRTTLSNAKIIAVDANPLNKPLDVNGFLLGTGVRADIGFITPNEVGQEFELKDDKAVLARFKVIEGNAKRVTKLPDLPANPVKEPDLVNAKLVNMTLEWDAADDDNGDPLFWNLKTKAGQRPANCTYPNQIADLMLGKSYIFSIRNNTQYPHPVHFHGHTFRVLKSNKKEFDFYLADTVVLEKNEQVEVAFVADNPGHWMFHCHIIEHMVMGLVGLVKVA